MNYPNPHAKKMLTGGSISVDPIQKAKSMARRRRTMKNKGQGTRHMPGALKMPRKGPGGYYDHSPGLPY